MSARAAAAAFAGGGSSSGGALDTARNREAAPPADRGSALTGGLGAAPLAIGGVLSIVFHVLYDVGHGPTVLNEHNKVLGLTNDTWSRVGAAWMALLAIGLLCLQHVHGGKAISRAVRVVVAGLALRAVADWWFGFYVPAELLLIAGRAWLASAVLRGRVLPRWSVALLLATVAGWLLFAVNPDAVYDASTDVAGVTVSGNDVLALVAGVAWVILGVGLHVATTFRKRLVAS